MGMLKRRVAASRLEEMGHIRIVTPCHNSAIAYDIWQKGLRPA